jgi:flagellar hook-basal body complex protein FliE
MLYYKTYSYFKEKNMEKLTDIERNRHINIALAYLKQAQDLYPHIIEMHENNKYKASLELFSIKQSFIRIHHYIDFFGESYLGLSTQRLIIKLTRIISSFPAVYRDRENERKLLENPVNLDESGLILAMDAYSDFVAFCDIHDEFLSLFKNAHLCLVVQNLVDLNISKDESLTLFKDDIYKFTSTSIEEIDSHQQGIFNQIDVKSRALYKHLEDIKKEFLREEEKIAEITQNSIEQIDRNFSAQQSSNFDSLTNQARTSINEIQLTAQNASNQFLKQVDSQISEIKIRIENEINQFQSHKDEIEGILGDISHAHQSNANRLQADKEEKVADILRICGVVGLFSVIIFSLYLFNSYLGFFGETIITDSQLSTKWFLVRFLTITLLTTPFIYLLKESAIHRARENLYRQRGTQLSSIGAYLAELDIEERTLLKKELARNFFSFHDGKADTQNVPDFLRDMKQLVGIAKSINSSKQSVSERLRRK